MRSTWVWAWIGAIAIAVMAGAAARAGQAHGARPAPSSPDGAGSHPFTGAPFPITDSERRQLRPDVAGAPELGDCQNLVVWWDETEGEVWGRFVEREWRGGPFRISDVRAALGRPKVAYNAQVERWLVVWRAAVEGERSALLARYVACPTAEGDVFAVSDGAGEVEPVVSASGEHFAVAWRRARDGGVHDLVGALVVDRATRHGLEITEPGAVSQPAIACEARGDCLVAWAAGPDEDLDIEGRYWFPREEVIGNGVLTIAGTPRRERYPAVAWNGWHAGEGHAAYAVTWTDEAAVWTVRARTVFATDPTGVDTYVVGDDPVVVSAIDRMGEHADVAPLGPGFVAVWHTRAESANEIVARRLLHDPVSQRVRAGASASVSRHDEGEHYPAVASALDPVALVVWQIEWPSRAVDVLGRHVELDGEGEPGDEGTQTPGEPDPTGTRESPEGTRTPDEPDPTGTRESPEGTQTPGEPDPGDTPEPEPPTATPVAGGEAFPVTDREGRQVRPDVAGHPETIDCQNLVVWWDETHGQVWGRFIEPDWRGDAFVVSGDHAAAGRPKVAYNHHSKLWLVVFASATDGDGTRIAGRYVQCGELEGPVFPIGGETRHDGDQPVVADHGERFAVAWRREVDGGPHRIVGVQVAGRDSGQYAEISPAGHVQQPAIDCEGRGDCLVAWSVEEDGIAQVEGRYWFPREEYVGERRLAIASSDAAARYPSVAWNGWHAEDGRGAYAVTWTHGGDEPRVFARTVYPGRDERLDGYVVADDAVLVSAGDDVGAHGDVAPLGADFVAVWSGGAESPGVLARRVAYSPDDHGLAPGRVVVVDDRDRPETYPAVASALDPLALAVWQIEWDAGADVVGRHVGVPERSDGRVVVLGSIVDDVVQVSDAASPSGFVAPRPQEALAARSWWLHVSKVTEGTLACEMVVLTIAEGANVDESVRVGDIVVVAADRVPDGGACELSVGSGGTYVAQRTAVRLAAPIVLDALRR